MKIRVCDICGTWVKDPPLKNAYVLKRRVFQKYPDECEYLHRLDICDNCMTAITAGIIAAIVEEKNDKKKKESGDANS